MIGAPVFNINKVCILKRIILLVGNGGSMRELLIQLIIFGMSDYKICFSPGIDPLGKTICHTLREWFYVGSPGENNFRFSTLPAGRQVLVPIVIGIGFLGFFYNCEDIG